MKTLKYFLAEYESIVFSAKGKNSIPLDTSGKANLVVIKKNNRRFDLEKNRIGKCFWNLTEKELLYYLCKIEDQLRYFKEEIQN